MSEVRVFELAKELKMPAKQLLSKMRKAGIPVTGNFSEMSVEQAEIVRDMAKSATGIVVPESVKRTTSRQKNSSEKTAAKTDLSEKSKKVKASKMRKKLKKLLKGEFAGREQIARQV
jgi:translation initiation factor IF-2